MSVVFDVHAHGGKDHRKKVQQDTIRSDSSFGKENMDNSMQMGKSPMKRVERENYKAEMSDFPSLHPMVVHFPIVLLLVAVFTQLASLFFFRQALSLTTLIFLLIGFCGAYISSTYVHPHTGELDTYTSNVLEWHEKFAKYTLWLSAIALILKIIVHFVAKNKLAYEIAVTVIIGVSAYCVSMAGHYGAQLTYIEGIGPKGNLLEMDHAH